LPFLRSKNSQPFFSPEDKEAIVWFWHNYLKSKMPTLIVVFGMIAVQGLVYQQFLRLTEDGLRVIFENGAMRDLLRACAMVLGVFFVRGVVSYLTPKIAAIVANDAIRQMRIDMIERYLSLDLKFFDHTTTGDVLLRLVQQAEGLSTFIGVSTIKALRDAATIIALTGYLMYKQPLLFSTTLLLVPLIIFALERISRKIKDIQSKAEAALAVYINGIEEMTNGMRTVRIAGQEEMELNRLSSATQGIRNLMVNLQREQAKVFPWLDFAGALAFVVVIGGGGYMVLNPNFEVDGAGIIAFLIGVVLIFDPGRRLSSFFVTLQASLVILKSVRGVFHEHPTIFDKPGATSDFEPLGDIRLDGVSFGYSDDQPVLKNIDMLIEGGKTTAIVGPTGSGKTTILSLLGRLYEVTGGEITIGGVPIEDIKIKPLRQCFSVVAQDIVIFNTSILENIRYVKADATDEEVLAAAEAAELKELIEQRQGKSVGPKGAQLSGGQKQRIAIARAFLRDEPIVLLDEATSALDQQTEDRVKRALGRLTKGRTTIVVAHRLSAVTDADRIYVLESGNVVESGTHQALLDKKGFYASLYMAQRQGYSD
jgi:ATP-binding cassette subfamily B protein